MLFNKKDYKGLKKYLGLYKYLPTGILGIDLTNLFQGGVNSKHNWQFQNLQKIPEISSGQKSLNTLFSLLGWWKNLYLGIWYF